MASLSEEWSRAWLVELLHSLFKNGVLRGLEVSDLVPVIFGLDSLQLLDFVE